jgi:hypothetical protein
MTSQESEAMDPQSQVTAFEALDNMQYFFNSGAGVTTGANFNDEMML